MNHKFKTGDIIESITSFKSTLEIICIDEKDRYVTRYPGYNNTLTDCQKWVEDNYKLVTENMENTIEVGDTIGSLKFLEGTQGVVNHIENDKYYIGNREEQHYTFAQARLISKAVKQEVIGYELLKDLPGIPAGTKSNEYNGRKAFFTNYTAQYPDLNDTTWFKPIYKAIKPTEILVGTLAGKVSVTKENLSISDEKPITVADFKALKVRIAGWYANTLHHRIVVETFKVGCKTFHVDDIIEIQEAIKQVQ